MGRVSRARDRPIDHYRGDFVLGLEGESLDLSREDPHESR